MKQADRTFMEDSTVSRMHFKISLIETKLGQRDFESHPA